MAQYKDGCPRCNKGQHPMGFMPLPQRWRGKANAPSRKEVNRMSNDSPPNHPYPTTFPRSPSQDHQRERPRSMNETHDLNKQPNVSERAVPRYPANRPDAQAPQQDPRDPNNYAKGPGGDPIHEPLLKYFEGAHLPPHLRSVSQDFETLAEAVVRFLPRNPERTVCLRKLLEAKDCAVRAAVTGPVT